MNNSKFFHFKITNAAYTQTDKKGRAQTKNKSCLLYWHTYILLIFSVQAFYSLENNALIKEREKKAKTTIVLYKEEEEKKKKKSEGVCVHTLLMGVLYESAMSV